jgi:hypothetical protein
MAFAVLAQKQIIVGQQWCGIRAKIRENESGDLLGFVRRMLYAILITAVRGLRGLFETPALDIVKPTMVAATNPGIFDPAELQRGTAVRAVQTEESQTVVPIPKKH